MINQIIKNCEDEEIQFLNEIQPFGYLIGIHKNSHQIEFYSQNIDELFQISAENVLNQDINQLYNFELDFDEVLNLDQGEFCRTHLKINSKTYHLTSYHFDELIYLELEELIILENRLAYYNFSEQILYSKSIDATWDRLISSIKKLINYDRVMLYKFLEDGSGVVIAEEIDNGLDSYLGLRFPEFDIPKQARQLYLEKKSRLVADVNSNRISLIATNHQRINLMYSSVRALSPIHLQYLRNANCAASFSISIVINEKLWGIVACQNSEPKFIPNQVRLQTELLTRQARLTYVNFKATERLKFQNYFNETAIKLKENLLTEENLQQSMNNNLKEVLNLTKANGIALVNFDDVFVEGETPDKHEILRIKEWAFKRNSARLFTSNTFYLDYGQELNLSPNSAGVMFCFLNQTYEHFIIWFKKEQVQTLNWAGEPNKIKHVEIVDGDEILSFSPRTSFKIWQENIKNKSFIWLDKEKYVAKEVIKLIIETLHLQSFKIHSLYEQLKEINDELDSFSYTVSHDLRTPLSVMKLNCQMIQRTLEHDEIKSDRLKSVIDEIDRMTQMMQDLLALSKAKKSEIVLSIIETKPIIEKIVHDVLLYYKTNDTQVVIEEVHNVLGDKTMFYEVFLNIIGNAIKYSSQAEHPIIKIWSELNEEEVIFKVKDNGIGIKQEDYNKMFKLFSRMSNTGNISGNGVGLSIAHRMMDRMNGGISFESKVGEGTTFILTFKKI
ncbi:GAF domain-containing protein [Empedobacter falsenii]|uniref:ATP-binding protein n=1 Tax=Empedobacter falsenii TaxID=343874 RepID=UPI0025752C00|nr:ATP-binding protein [Empedobacter falsenii]MDM1297994.1 GAF domain-containing protein [Empedobacter falsenii]MDM1317931.1 GAF domain-containing protein [Empedobacter falsenii]